MNLVHIAIEAQQETSVAFGVSETLAGQFNECSLEIRLFQHSLHGLFTKLACCALLSDTRCHLLHIAVEFAQQAKANVFLNSTVPREIRNELYDSARTVGNHSHLVETLLSEHLELVAELVLVVSSALLPQLASGAFLHQS